MIKKVNLTKTGTFHMQTYMLSKSAEMYIVKTAGNRRDRPLQSKHFTVSSGDP